MGDTEKTMWMHGDGFQSIEKIEQPHFTKLFFQMQDQTFLKIQLPLSYLEKV